MNAASGKVVQATGRCLCGAVRYTVSGPLRDVVLCHCTMCRRMHGHVGAYAAAARSDFEIVESRGLRWYASSPLARRGFCGECGSALFWDAPARELVSITAGTLDAPTGLATMLQIHVDSAGDYYRIDDRIPVR